MCVPVLKLSCLQTTLASEMVSPSKETGRKVPVWHTSSTPSFGEAPPIKGLTSPWIQGTTDNNIIMHPIISGGNILS